MVYTNNDKKHCYPILADLIVDYKEQILSQALKQIYNAQFTIFYLKKKG